ncbi:MAG: phage tail tube protein [Spongiibacteraceae bacterium]
MSNGNNVGLIYVPELVAGTTPVDSPNWQTLRVTGESLQANPQKQTSNEIRADRQSGGSFLTSMDIGGDLNFEFSATTFDDLMEMALGGTWTADVLKVGSTERSITVEKQYLDLAVPEYHNFTKVRTNTWTLDAAHGDAVTGTFGLMGSGFETPIPTASSVGAGSVAAATATAILNGSSHMSGITVDGVDESDACLVRSISLSQSNNMAALNALGKLAPCDHNLGGFELTGSIEMYFRDSSLYEKAISNEYIEIQYTITDGTNSYLIFLPRVDLKGAPDGASRNTELMLKLDFTAHYDDTEASSIVITRT